MKYKVSVGSVVFDALNITVLVLFSLLCIVPFYYVLVYALSDPQLSAGGITFFPKGFTFENFVKIFQLKNIASSAVISVTRTVVGTAVSILCSSFFAYLVTKPMYFRKIIYRMLVFTMYVSAGLVPSFLVMRMYGLFNNILVYIVPSLISAYNVILIKTFIEQLPASLEESAMLDGAGIFTIYSRLIVPLSKPILATVVVFIAVGQWNAWFDAHIYIMERSQWPMQYVLYRYLLEAQSAANRLAQENVTDMETIQITPTAVRMSMTALVTVPVLFVYPFMQRYFLKGIMIGAIKG